MKKRRLPNGGESTEVRRRGEGSWRTGNVRDTARGLDRVEHVRGVKEKKRTIRPDGAELVVPYRWPAGQGPGESLEAYESRLAEYELEMFLKSKEPMVTVALEKA